MDFRNWDKDLELRIKRREAQASPRVNHTEWVKNLVRKQGVENAYRICRRLGVPRFIYKKTSVINEQAGFYQSALGFLKNQYPIQSKHGVGK